MFQDHNFVDSFGVPANTNISQESTTHDPHSTPAPTHSSIPGLSPIIWIIMVLLVVSFVVFLIYEAYHAKYWWNVPQVEREQIWLGVRNDHSRINYVVLFRIGCPTKLFDMNNSFINFEVLGNDRTSQGIECRFNCSQIADPSFCELSVDISRVSEMSQISGIRAHHGSNHGEIFFYEYVCAVGDNEIIIQRNRVFEYITTSKKDFVGHPTNPAGMMEETAGTDFPDVPVPTMRKLDKLLFSYHIILFSGFIAGIFFKYELYYSGAGEAIAAIQIILLLSFFLSLFYAVLLFVFKFIVLRRILRDEVVANKEFPETLYLKYTILTILGLTSLVLIYLIIAYVKFDTEKSLWWYSTVLNVCVIIIGLWSCMESSHFIRNMCEAERISDIGSRSASASTTKVANQSDNQMFNAKTILFSTMNSKKQMTVVSNFLSVPMFANPHFSKKKNSKPTSKQKTGVHKSSDKHHKRNLSHKSSEKVQKKKSSNHKSTEKDHKRHKKHHKKKPSK